MKIQTFYTKLAVGFCALLWGSSAFAAEPKHENVTDGEPQVDTLTVSDPSALVLKQSRQARPARQPATKPQRRPGVRQERKKPALVTFWRIFPPPGRYTKEIGLSVGANFLETAYGGRNPNVIYRGHFTFRPRPNQFPLVVYGMADYSDYEQTAGPLEYTSRFFTLGAGAGVNYWVGPLRFDLTGEAGLLTRISTQTDGQIDPITKMNVQPVIGAVTGGALAIGGHVALSLRAAARMYDFGPSRIDLSVLYGLEWMIDAKPFRYY